jgi:hypothetical protein
MIPWAKAKAGQSHTGAKGEGRMKNAENDREIGQCDPNATSKPPQSLLVAN